MNDIVFVRIPKNASTSIYHFLGENNVIRNELFSMDNEKYLNIFEPSHCTLSEAVHFLGMDIIKKPILAVIRNPYDRLVSMFFFARKYDLGRIYGIDTEDFDAFAEQFYAHSADPHFFHATSQKDFISVGDFMPKVCRFEDLSADMERFIDANKMGHMLNAADLPKLNGTVHKNYREYFSDKSKAIVEAMWKDDLEYFNYEF